MVKHFLFPLPCLLMLLGQAIPLLSPKTLRQLGGCPRLTTLWRLGMWELLCPGITTLCGPGMWELLRQGLSTWWGPGMEGLCKT